jgi:hypothetical protein
MPLDRLPDAVGTMYAELLDQALAHERAAGLEGAIPGGLVEKQVRGRTYLYWQVRGGGHTLQRYLGPDTPALREDVRHTLARRRDLAADREMLARLAAMVAQGGGLREDPGPAEVLCLLADLGLFRRGAVVVGTQAYRTFGNVLGVRLPAQALRTQDIDIAQARAISIAAAAEPAPELEGRLAVLGLLPVPGLDPRRPSTSFSVRGRELRVDFLTPARSAREEAPVRLPSLGVAAQPLRLLEYLIEAPIPAVMLARRPALLRVPRPARFALHKLWTAAQRPVSEQAKAQKDRRQAESLLEVLAADRPDDLHEALAALAPHRQARSVVERELRRIPSAAAEALLREIEGR